MNRLVLTSLALGVLGCDPQSRQAFEAAARITSAASSCLRAILTAERSRCDNASDRETCLADAERRFIALNRDIDTVRAQACDSSDGLEVVFAGECQP